MGGPGSGRKSNSSRSLPKTYSNNKVNTNTSGVHIGDKFFPKGTKQYQLAKRQKSKKNNF